MSVKSAPVLCVCNMCWNRKMWNLCISKDWWWQLMPDFNQNKMESCLLGYYFPSFIHVLDWVYLNPWPFSLLFFQLSIFLGIYEWLFVSWNILFPNISHKSMSRLSELHCSTFKESQTQCFSVLENIIFNYGSCGLILFLISGRRKLKNPTSLA